MPSKVSDRVSGCLRKFLDSVGINGGKFDDKTNLTKGLGLKSDQGIDFVLELCDEFSLEFPEDFNPFVHDNGARGRTFGELVKSVEAA
jgi:hypothetical protein